MATQQRRTRPAAEAPAPTRTRRTRPAPEPEPVEEPAGRDVTVYADKEATPFHRAFAKWIVTEVGYRPSQAESLKEAFLAGVSIATAARPAFNDSQWLEDWREENGIVKRGRKRADEVQEEAPAPTRTRRRKPEPEPEPDEDDIDDDDDFDDDTDADDTDDDDFDEPAPVAPKRGRPATKATAAPAKAQGRRPAAKAAPAAKATGTRRAKPADDDFAF